MKMGDSSDNKHPRENANFLSMIFYIYTFDTFKKGFKKQWKAENIYDSINSHKSEVVGDEIVRRWREEKQNCATRKTAPNLFRTLFGMFWPELLFAAFLLGVAQILLRLTEPILLGKLLKYFKEDNSVLERDAMEYGIYIALVIGARIVFYNQYKMCTYNTVLKTRVACSSLIYKKVLCLSLNSLQKTTTGQILNYISYDLNRFDSGADLVHFIWVAPIFVLSISYILYIETGFSGLVGVLWFSFVAVLQSYNGNLNASIYGKLNRKSSNRLKIMNEVISGIQVIKMFAWEKSFEKLVSLARKEELNAVIQLNYVRNIFFSFSSICNHLALFFTLFVIIAMKQNITSAKVYGLVVYYSVLNFIVSIMFILAISKSVEVYKTISRLNEFLLRDDFCQNSTVGGTDSVVVQMNDVEAKWSSSASLQSNNKLNRIRTSNMEDKKTEKEVLVDNIKNRAVLQNINLALNRGNLIGVVGPVGCGKSSLLQTILGELELSSGNIQVQNSMSYAPQDSWTFAGTVRENIIFGQKFDENRYREVVRVCCLERDFDLFPSGDQTLVGDRGASLSGGQKSRINLARAVYRDKNIYLLDDPLSAVDVQVAKYIYQECIEKFLKDKCRILVTHHIHHLKTADYIIVLNQGSIQDSGTYDDLLRKNYVFETKSHVNKTMKVEQTSLDKEVPSIIDDLSEEAAEKIPLVDNIDDLPVAFSLNEARNNKTKKLYLVIKYFFKSTRFPFFIFIFLIFSLTQALISSTDFFLSSWVNVEEHRNQTDFGRLRNFYKQFAYLSSEEFLGIYGGLILVIGLFGLLRSVLYVNFFGNNSKKLHNNMFTKVIYSSMEFFDGTPSGQIINRFSRDMQVADEYLPRAIMEALIFVNTLFAAIAIVLLFNPFIIVMVAIMSLMFILISILYMRTSKNIKEVESSLLSPILSHLNETMQGLPTIRGLGATAIVENKFNRCVDQHASSWYMFSVAFAAFGFYIELISFLFISVVTVSLIALGKDLGLTASEVGLAITQSMVLSAIVQYGVLNCAQINNLLVSIGRILEYNSTPQEDQPAKPEIPPPTWPEHGQITFENVCLRYSIHKPLVLKNLNFVIEPCEKVGIVGRTGAGKSSLLLALFRLAKVTGLIEIDGIDTKNLDLQTLRSKISVIPQDPVLFNGTLRDNLDPFNEYDDSTLYEVLKAVELNSGSRQVKKLSARVRDRGSNYSVGQRQLICLARAIIRKNKIVILDEATANVDSKTDMAITETIRKQFSNCTVLTVAHRLSTVMNSDKILVIDAGELVEIGHPYVLLNNTSGRFYSMVAQTGSSIAEHLKNLDEPNNQRRPTRND